MANQELTQTRDDASTGKRDQTMLPPVDIIEDSTGITVYADLPGVPKDKLNVRVEDETLTVDAEIVLPLPEGMQASHAEVQRTRYHRAFRLSRELDPNQVEANLSQGVLKVRIPKAAHAQPRRISVQVA